MKKIAAVIVLFLLLLVRPAIAQERNKHFGVQVDVGAPDGVAAGFLFRPLPWTKFTLAGAYNVVSPGIRVGQTFDPIDFPIAPTFTIEAGGFWKGKIPGVKDFPEFSYLFVNAHLGLEFGDRDSWRFFIHAGPSFISAKTSGINNAIKNDDPSLSISELRIFGFVFPSAKLGFCIYF